MQLTKQAHYIAKQCFNLEHLTEDGEWCLVHVSAGAKLCLDRVDTLPPIPDARLAIFRLVGCGQTIAMSPHLATQRLQPL